MTDKQTDIDRHRQTDELAKIDRYRWTQIDRHRGVRMKHRILPKDIKVEFKHNALSSTVFATGFNFESYRL